MHETSSKPMHETNSNEMANKPELRMSREFAFPKRLVFEAWSKAEYVSKWFTPAPLTTPECVVDLRSGGVFRVVMRMPDGQEFPMDAVFTEVIPDERRHPYSRHVHRKSGQNHGERASALLARV